MRLANSLSFILCIYSSLGDYEHGAARYGSRRSRFICIRFNCKRKKEGKNGWLKVPLKGGGV